MRREHLMSNATQVEANKARKIAARRLRLALAAQAVAERKNRRNNRSPEQQLAALDKRLGAGKGARDERARLNKELANAA